MLHDDGRLYLTTRLGPVQIGWTADGLSRVVLGEPGTVGAPAADVRRAGAGVPEAIVRLAGDISRYFEGDRVDFAHVVVDFAAPDPFCLAIWTTARTIPYGRTWTYGELAAEAGHPGAARETGQALGRNPVPVVVPCHRIVASGGKPGGFSAAGGLRTKLRLLALEGASLKPTVPQQGVLAF